MACLLVVNDVTLSSKDDATQDGRRAIFGETIKKPGYACRSTNRAFVIRSRKIHTRSGMALLVPGARMHGIPGKLDIKLDLSAASIRTSDLAGLGAPMSVCAMVIVRRADEICSQASNGLSTADVKPVQP